MAKFTKIAALTTAVEAARRYAQKNPDQAGKFLDQAAAFVDKQTKGKYTSKITDAARKVKGAAGLPTQPGAGPVAGPIGGPAGGPVGNGHIAPPPSPAPRPAPQGQQVPPNTAN